ncbi:MAG: hypothetical protein B7Z66_02635 [Chromatiales bacterium 21-64-14]|nr:MAG: hypothetical protein B7Z66_02635 [Chromatiales bacterium 21-64-14]
MFVVVVLAELLALVLVLAPPRYSTDLWSDLSLVSLFIQWVALGSAALLCALRRRLARLENTRAGWVSYGLLLAVTLIVSESAYWLLQLNSLHYGGVGQGHLGFVSRNLLVASIVSAVVLRYLYIQHQWKRNVQAEAQARVQALQARIRPHFLFNSMNTIASLTRERPDLAEEAVEDLADLFRASLAAPGQRVSLGDELTMARRYLHIEELRLGKRLQVDWQLNDLPLDLPVPPLILQPLFENAIYHGIEPRPEGGMIRVEGVRTGNQVTLRLRNPVPERAATTVRRDGNHMALDNIRQRLELAYGTQGALSVREANGEFEVCLHLPADGVLE